MFGKSKELHEGLKTYVALDKTVSSNSKHTSSVHTTPVSRYTLPSSVTRQMLEYRGGEPPL